VFPGRQPQTLHRSTLPLFVGLHVNTLDDHAAVVK